MTKGVGSDLTANTVGVVPGGGLNQQSFDYLLS